MKWYSAIDLNWTMQKNECFLIFWPQSKSTRYVDFILRKYNQYR